MFIFTFIYTWFRLFLYYSKKCKSDYNMEMIVGQIGTGKSTVCCALALKELKKGKKVYVDFPCKIPGVRKYNPDDLAKYLPDKESVLFVDEGSLRWFSRNFKTFQPFTEFFALVRHAKCKIVLCSQSFDVDLYIRNRCASLYLIKRVGAVSVVRRIKKLQVVNEMNGKQTSQSQDNGGLVDGYKYDSIFAKGSIRFFWLPRYWRLHDSFYLPERPSLPYVEVLDDDEM